MMTVNAMGKACPLPVIETKQALMKSPEGVVTLVDNEIAVQNLQKLAAQMGMAAAAQTLGENSFQVTITPSEACAACTPEAAVPEAAPTAAGPTVVVLSSNAMGTGDDELGRALMNGFVFALTQLDHFPDTVLLYNGGAKLSTGDAPTVKDLKALEEAGVEVLTCGTCLNHYGLTEQLAVGSVTNMYEICSRMASAGRLVRP